MSEINAKNGGFHSVTQTLLFLKTSLMLFLPLLALGSSLGSLALVPSSPSSTPRMLHTGCKVRGGVWEGEEQGDGQSWRPPPASSPCQPPPPPPAGEQVSALTPAPPSPLLLRPGQGCCYKRLADDSSHLMEANPVLDREILPLLPGHLSQVLQVLLVAQEENLSWGGGDRVDGEW